MAKTLMVLGLAAMVSACASKPAPPPVPTCAIKELIAQLEDDDLNVRTQAAFKVMRMGPAASAAVPALIENLGTGRGKEQALNVAATNALLRIGPGAALAPLVEALEGEDREVAYGAAFTIGGFGRSAKSAVPALMKALEDPDTREPAATALAMIRDGV